MANKSEIEKVLAFLQSGKITEDQRLRCMAKLIGYERMPPTVEEILDSDEYLNRWFGKKRLYPYWRERILDLYPNPIETTAMVVINKGAIGTGKSFCAMAIAHIDLIKLSCLSYESAHDYFMLTPGQTPWTYRCFNVNLPKASDLFITPMQTVIEQCEYWRSWRQINKRAMPCDLQLLPSSRPNQILSEALFGCIASELNFYRYDVATEIITKALGRMTSRFESGKFYFNHMILDSSDTFEDSCVEQFIKQGAYSDCQYISHVTSWEAKAHKGTYFNEGEFWVYLGDSNTLPFIMDDEPNKDMSRLDPDRKLRVPRELYSEFKSDIIKALQDKAGVSVMTNTLFFTNKDMLSKHFDINYELDDSYVVDFFDDISLMDIIGKEKLLRALDLERPVFVRCDLGVSDDEAGIAICQFSHLKEYVVGDKVYKKPIWKIPVAFGVTRPVGQETPIAKIEDFILELSQSVTIKMFSTDQYQSTELRQNVYRRSDQQIPVGYLSVDINDRCYVSYKNTMLEERLHCCKNPILMKEANEIRRMGNKIDHPPKSEGGCFPGWTLVRTNNGLKPINQLNDKTDLVYTYNFDTNEYYLSKFKYLGETMKATKLIKITMDDGSVIECTEKHLIRTKEHGWVRASELNLNDELVDVYRIGTSQQEDLDVMKEMYDCDMWSTRDIAAIFGIGSKNTVQSYLQKMGVSIRENTKRRAGYRPFEPSTRKNQLFRASYSEYLFADLLDFFDIDYEQQFQIGNYYVDFYLPKYNLVIEIYGYLFHNDSTVSIEKDETRQYIIESQGYKFCWIFADINKKDMPWRDLQNFYNDFREIAEKFGISDIDFPLFENNSGVPPIWKVVGTDPSYKGLPNYEHWKFRFDITKERIQALKGKCTVTEFYKELNITRNGLKKHVELYFNLDWDEWVVTWTKYDENWNWKCKRLYLDKVDDGLIEKDKTCSFPTYEEFIKWHSSRSTVSLSDINAFFSCDGRSNNRVKNWFHYMMDSGEELNDFIKTQKDKIH